MVFYWIDKPCFKICNFFASRNEKRTEKTFSGIAPFLSEKQFNSTRFVKIIDFQAGRTFNADY